MKKQTVMTLVRDHHHLMIKEAKSLDEKILTLQAESRRFWKEIQATTLLVEKLDELEEN